jgi:hypothetical protein
MEDLIGPLPGRWKPPQRPTIGAWGPGGDPNARALTRPGPTATVEHRCPRDKVAVGDMFRADTAAAGDASAGGLDGVVGVVAGVRACAPEAERSA